MIFSSGISGISFFISLKYFTFVAINIFSKGIIFTILSIVSLIIVFSDTKSKNCFGFSSVDKGQNLVPEPPAIINATFSITLL